MNKKEINDRVNELLLQESENDVRLFWLSYANEDNFLGVVITEARGPMEAAIIVSSLDINPGGQMTCYPITELPKSIDKYSIMDRLLSQDDLFEAGLI